MNRIHLAEERIPPKPIGPENLVFRATDPYPWIPRRDRGVRRLLIRLRIHLNRIRLAHWLECLAGNHEPALWFPPGWLETTPNIYRRCIHCAAIEPDERPWAFVRRAA